MDNERMPEDRLTEIQERADADHSVGCIASLSTAQLNQAYYDRFDLLAALRDAYQREEMLLGEVQAAHQREDEMAARINQLEKHILDTSAFYRKTSGEIEAAIAEETQEEFDSLADSYRRQTDELAAVKRERDAEKKRADDAERKIYAIAHDGLCEACEQLHDVCDGHNTSIGCPFVNLFVCGGVCGAIDPDDPCTEDYTPEVSECEKSANH